MIKDLSTITEKDLKIYSEQGFSVWEKIDAYYFRAEFTKVGVIATKGSTGKAISDIDCIVNDMYKTICDFVSKNLEPIRANIIEKYGEMYFGFFFFPSVKPHKIKYIRTPINTFMLSNYKRNDGEEIPWSDMSELLSDMQGDSILSAPPMIHQWLPMETEPTGQCSLDWICDSIREYASNKNSDPLHIVKRLTGDRSFTKISVSEMEGIVLRPNAANKPIYQVTLKNTEDHIDREAKLLCRNTLLKAFVDDMSADETLLDSVAADNRPYVDKVATLFIRFINNTDLLRKYFFDPDDLLPPTSGYMGDIDYDAVSDSNVKVICKYNEVNKNIFRLLLHTFATNISEDKFSSLPEYVQDYLNKLIIALKYKNYKEIMLTAYKIRNN